MAMTAEQALKRAAKRILGRLSGRETVGKLEKRVREVATLAKQRPITDPSLSFNEAAGLLGISTRTLESLIREHPRDPPLFQVPGAKKRTTTLTRLFEWADELRAKGAWKPLTERGASPDALLVSKLPFLVVTDPGRKQVVLDLVDPSLEWTDELRKTLQEAVLKHGVRMRIMALAEGLAMPWRDPRKQQAWADAFEEELQHRAEHLRALSLDLDALRARVRADALERRLPPASE